jgi:hypothetical protein
VGQVEAFMRWSLVLGAWLVCGCGASEKVGPPAPEPPAPPALTETASAPASAVNQAEADWQVLVDLDEMHATPPVAKPETIAKLAGATFKTYRKSKKDCTGKNDAVLFVDGGYEGAFRKKDAKEMLYLVSVLPCDSKLTPVHTLLVLQSGKVVVSHEVPEHDIVEVRDLDMDGDNEILLLGGLGDVTKARLVDTEDGNFEALFDFGEVARGSCDNGAATGQSAVIKYRKTATSMEYKAEKKPKTCK